MQIWTELKTAHPNPIGHGRTGGIQPDYTVAYEPVDDPESSILVVEGKQSLRSALRIHADALADYTSGRPDAQVIVAAYGPVSCRALDGLKDGAKQRAHVVRHLRPGQSPPLDEFRALVTTHTSTPVRRARLPVGPLPRLLQRADDELVFAY